MSAPELRCRFCRRNLYPPPGATGTLRIACPRCGKRQTLVLPAEPVR